MSATVNRTTAHEQAEKLLASVVVERKAAPPDMSHRCRLPGFFRRQWLRLRRGAIVRCVECGSRWEWTYHSDWADSWWSWEPVNAN